MAEEILKPSENKLPETENKMDLFAQLREVPAEAIREIKAGKLKGFSDVNPMWRIKKLTEVFGPYGIGWYTEITDTRTVSLETGEIALYMDINLYYKYKGEWSRPIYGTGGNMLVTADKVKTYSGGKYVDTGERKLTLNDEAYKMAYTDALSVAGKMIGLAASVYFAKDRTKYSTVVEEPARETPKVEYATEEQRSYIQQAYAKCPDKLTAYLQKEYKKNNVVQLTKDEAQSFIDTLTVARKAKEAKAAAEKPFTPDMSAM